MPETRLYQAFKEEPLPIDPSQPNDRLSAQFGCNGVHHVISYAVVTLDAQGQVLSGAPSGFDQMGLCDGSCHKSTCKRGEGFIYEYNAAAEHAEA